MSDQPNRAPVASLLDVPPDPPPAGARNASLELALAASRARRSRRLATRVGGGTLAAGLALVLGLALLKPSPVLTPPAPEIGPIVEESPPVTDEAVAPIGPIRVASMGVGYVANDADVLARYAPDASADRVVWLTDDEVLAELRSAGMPAGLVKTSEATRVAFHHATTTPTSEITPLHPRTTP